MSIKSQESVTTWIGRLEAGDHDAAQLLWERYYRQLVRLVRRKLGNTPRRVADEEDIALSAFHSFCRGAAAGRFPRLDDRDNLWQLLVTISARKVIRQINHDRRKKRGGGRDSLALERIVAEEPTPELAAILGEEFQLLLTRLDSEDLARVAMMKLEGFSTEDIASELGCSTRTVKRKLQLIRTIWGSDR